MSALWPLWPASWWPRRRGHGPHARVLYGTPRGHYDYRTAASESGPRGEHGADESYADELYDIAKTIVDEPLPTPEPQWWELPVLDTEPAPVFAATGPVPALPDHINPNTIGWNREEMLLRIYAHGRGGGA